MLYDKTPQYPHFAHLPFAKEPFRAIYVLQRIITTCLLVPIWILQNLPRSRRPRKSWSLRQVIFVNFTRRIYRVTEVAGVTWGTREPNSQPGPNELQETIFEWAPPLKEIYRQGAVVDRFGRVPFKKIGSFVWRKPAFDKESIPVVAVFLHGGGYSQLSAHEKSRTSHIPRRLMKDNLFTEIYAVEYRLLQHAPLPAVFMDAASVYAHVVEKYYGSDYHKSTESTTAKPCKIILIGDSSGGNLALALARWVRDEQQLPMPDGLLLFSPSCDTSHAFPSTHSSYIPRPNEIDYLTDTPEPRALMQRTFLGFKYRPGGTGWGQWNQGRSRDGGDQLEKHFMKRGEGSGTNRLAAAMASAASASTLRLANGVKGVARSMGVLGGPISSDPESQTQATSFATEDTDSVTDQAFREESPEERQERERREMEEETRSLMEIIHSEYVSPASPRVLRRWGHVVDLYDGRRIGGHQTQSGAGDRPKENAHKMCIWLTPTIVSEQYDWETNPTNDNERSQSSSSASPSNASDSVTSNSNTLALPEVKSFDFARSPPMRNQDASDSPHSYRSRYPKFRTLFDQFPKTLILIGDAERLTIEVSNLARAMGKDVGAAEAGSTNASGSVDDEDLPKEGLVSLGNGGVQVRWIPDAVHDVFMIPPGWWDEKVKSEVWEDVKTWITEGFYDKQSTDARA